EVLRLEAAHRIAAAVGDGHRHFDERHVHAVILRATRRGCHEKHKRHPFHRTPPFTRVHCNASRAEATPSFLRTETSNDDCAGGASSSITSCVAAPAATLRSPFDAAAVVCSVRSSGRAL